MNTYIAIDKKKLNINYLNYISYLPFATLAFFIPNITFSNMINPFVAVYLSVLIGYKKKGYKFYISSFFIFLGIVINNFNHMLIKNLSTFLILICINYYFTKRKIRPTIFNKATISFICVMLSHLLLLYMYNLNYFYLVVTMFDASLAFLFTLFLFQGISILDIKKIQQLKRLSTNEIISLTLFLCLVLYGMRFNYVGYINIQLAFFTFLILFISFNFGSAYSTLISFIFVFSCGIITNSISFNFGYMLLLSSALSGIYKNKNKYFNVLLFLSGILIMYFYFLVYNIDVISFEYVITSFFISSTLFLLLPENVYSITHNSLNNIIYGDNTYSPNYSNVELIEGKFNQQLKTFNNLSNFFKTQHTTLKNANNITSDCKQCNNLNLKLIESNYLLHKQYDYLSSNILKIINTVSNKYDYKHSIEKRLSIVFKENGILVKSICVFLNNNGKYEVIIKKSSFSNYIKTNNIDALINEVLPVNMQLTTNSKEILHYIQHYKYNVLYSVASLKKSENTFSGDTFSILESNDGDVTLTLCDGMGSGELANKYSTLTIELFEDFINASFDKKTAIELVNSMLLIREDSEFFSSLDACTINKYNGLLTTYKVGASSTYILRNNQVEAIQSKTLPIGILNNIEVEINDMQLLSGDIVIMMTDGVIDSNYTVSDKESWLSNKLCNCKLKTPQSIANFLIEETKKQYRGYAQDDCTILVSKIWTN